MNIVSKVTVKHMKENRKRTMVTILGIMLSVALITAISAFAASFLDLMRQSCIASEGEWHTEFYEVKKEQLSRITEDDKVKKTLIRKELGNAVLEGGENEWRPYITVEAYDENAMETYPLPLKEGRYPENPEELLISEHMLENTGVDWKLGDQVTLDLGIRWLPESQETEAMELPSYYNYSEGEILKDQTAHTYTIVGIMNRTRMEDVTYAGYLAVTKLDVDVLPAEETVDAAVQMKHLDKSMYAWSDGVAEELGVLNGNNTTLLAYSMISGNSGIVHMLNLLKWIMMLIVAAGSVAVIYSSFSISISERGRYLGMLASVGATRKQKRDSVLTEAVLLGIIGIPLGLLLGYLGVFVVTKCIQGLIGDMLNYGMDMETVSMRVIVSWPAIAGAVILAAVTIFVSAWIPAARASRITPVEAIRQNRDIKLSRKQVKTSKLTRKLFGFEGELALKNLKRNKKRYRATVISLIFCIALYLSVSSFTEYLKGAYQMASGLETANYPDYSVSIYELERKEQEKLIEKIRNLSGYAEMEVTDFMNYNFYPSAEALDPEVRKEATLGGGMQTGGKHEETIAFNLQVIGLDDQSMEAYVKKIGADGELLKQGGAILINRRMDIKEGRRAWKQTWSLRTGDTLTGDFWFVEHFEDTEKEPEEKLASIGIPVAGVTDELPLGGSYSGDINTVTMYTTMETALKLRTQKAVMENTEVSESCQIYLTAENKEILGEGLNELDENRNLYVYDATGALEQFQNMLLLMNVFVYGFIILTALICVTSIFNTISTSMALRKREYAMLQSVGMDPKRFRRMITYESFFYGLKALIWGLPIGIALMYLIYRSISEALDIGFYVLWNQVFIAVVSVLAVVGITMRYSARKIKKANIVETLKEENV